jgi:hypothetical protein
MFKHYIKNKQESVFGHASLFYYISRLYDQTCLLYMLAEWNEERDSHFDQKFDKLTNNFKKKCKWDSKLEWKDCGDGQDNNLTHQADQPEKQFNDRSSIHYGESTLS